MSDLRSEFGTIVKVKHHVEMEKKDGSGTYEVTVIKFKNQYGEKSKQVLSNFLAKNEELAGQIDSLSPGDHVEFKSTKNGQFLQLKEVVLAKKEPAKAEASFKPKGSFVDNSIGLQVGNALTNAAMLLAHGKGLDTLEDTAELIIRLGEKLKGKLAGGEFKGGGTPKAAATPAKPVTKKVKKPEPEEEEEEPFDDDDDSVFSED